MCRDGVRSSPGSLCISAETPGLLRSPSRRKAAPTGTAQASKTVAYLFSHSTSVRLNRTGSSICGACPMPSKVINSPLGISLAT
ncbi:hypothetical protein IAE39_002899 [Pseudomonas sp. S37]|nr:hypothetical protein [Pseudomonas sp. S37]